MGQLIDLSMGNCACTSACATSYDSVIDTERRSNVVVSDLEIDCTLVDLTDEILFRVFDFAITNCKTLVNIKHTTSIFNAILTEGTNNNTDEKETDRDRDREKQRESKQASTPELKPLSINNNNNNSNNNYKNNNSNNKLDPKLNQIWKRIFISRWPGACFESANNNNGKEIRYDLLFRIRLISLRKYKRRTKKSHRSKQSRSRLSLYPMINGCQTQWNDSIKIHNSIINIAQFNSNNNNTVINKNNNNNNNNAYSSINDSFNEVYGSSMNGNVNEDEDENEFIDDEFNIISDIEDIVLKVANKTINTRPSMLGQISTESAGSLSRGPTNHGMPSLERIDSFAALVANDDNPLTPPLTPIGVESGADTETPTPYGSSNGPTEFPAIKINSHHGNINNNTINNNNGTIMFDYSCPLFWTELTKSKTDIIRVCQKCNKKIHFLNKECARVSDGYLTKFIHRVGCNVYEMGQCMEKMDKSDRGHLWDKIMKGSPYTNKKYDVKRCILALVFIVDQRRKNQLKIKKKASKPDVKQVEKLVKFMMNKLPQAGLNETTRILTKDDFIKKMYLWLYQIAQSQEWKDETSNASH